LEQNNTSPNDFGHPACKGGTASEGIIRGLSKLSYRTAEALAAHQS